MNRLIEDLRMRLYKYWLRRINGDTLLLLGCELHSVVARLRDRIAVDEIGYMQAINVLMLGYDLPESLARTAIDIMDWTTSLGVAVIEKIAAIDAAREEKLSDV